MLKKFTLITNLDNNIGSEKITKKQGQTRIHFHYVLFLFTIHQRAHFNDGVSPLALDLLFCLVHLSVCRQPAYQPSA